MICTRGELGRKVWEVKGVSEDEKRKRNVGLQFR